MERPWDGFLYGLHLRMSEIQGELLQCAERFKKELNELQVNVYPDSKVDKDGELWVNVDFWIK